MEAELIDRLTTQYVWAIQNESAWHVKAREAQSVNYFGRFRHITGNFINRIEMQNGEKLKGIEWAFVILELWVQMGGDKFAALSDPGTLPKEYEQLIGGNAEAHKRGFVHRKGDLFCKYGDAYTHRAKHDGNLLQGKVYSESEMRFLEAYYFAGTDFATIANVMLRSGVAICEKMCVMGLLKRNTNGDYFCAKDVPKLQVQNADSNPCGEISLTPLNDLQKEISAHMETAAQHLGNVAEQLETIVKEKSMSVIATNPEVAIETRVVIFGQDAKSLSDQQIIDAIKRIEGDIAKLKEVKTSSKKIASNIKELEDNLAKIVEILDAR